jgi:hypothetical protein
MSEHHVPLGPARRVASAEVEHQDGTKDYLAVYQRPSGEQAVMIDTFLPGPEWSSFFVRFETADTLRKLLNKAQGEGMNEVPCEECGEVIVDEDHSLHAEWCSQREE